MKWHVNLEDKLEFIGMKERTIPGRGNYVLQTHLEAWGRAAASAMRGRLWSTRLAQGYSLCPVRDWWRGQRPGPLPHPAPHQGLDHPIPRTPWRISWGGCCNGSIAQPLPLPSPAPVYPSDLSIHTFISESLSREPGLRQWDMVQEQQSWCSPCHIQVESPPYWLCNCSYVLSLCFL